MRNKKSRLKMYLRANELQLSEAQVKRVGNSIRRAEKPHRRLNRYHQMVDRETTSAVREYIKSMDDGEPVVTVLELLNIKKFNKSRHSNGMFSTFAKGRLQQKLMSELTWHGCRYIEVDSAYTSQICPACGYLDKGNRSDTDHKDFTCLCCGHHDDDGHVGSVNIKNRATDSEILKARETYKYNASAKFKSIRDIYARRHKAKIHEVDSTP